MATFRILSLDGGGIMGAFTASVLAAFEDHTGQRIVEHFDLITGTSTGGLIAIALGMGVSTEKVLSFYKERGPEIFPTGGFLGGWVKELLHFFGPKFSTGELREAISSVVGEKTLGDSRCRLVIPAYDVDQGRVYLFKTAHHPRFQVDVRLPAVDVALATSAAPTYFPAHEIPWHGTYIDGGVWANSPVMVGVTEGARFPEAEAGGRPPAQRQHHQLPVPDLQLQADGRNPELELDHHRNADVRTGPGGDCHGQMPAS